MTSVVSVHEFSESVGLVDQVRVRADRVLQIPCCLDVFLREFPVGDHPNDVVADFLELFVLGDRLFDRSRVLCLFEVLDVEGRRTPQALLPEARGPPLALGALHRRDRRVLRLGFLLTALRGGDLRACFIAEPGDVVRGGLRPADPPKIRLQVGLRDPRLHRQHTRPRPPEVTGVVRSFDAGAVPGSVEDLPKPAVLQSLRRVVSVRLRLRAHPQWCVLTELASVTRRVDLQPPSEIRRANGETDVSRAGLCVRRDGDDEVVPCVCDAPDVKSLELRFGPEAAAPLDRDHRAIPPVLCGLDHRDDVVLPVEDAGGFRRRVALPVRRFQDVLPLRDATDGRERVDELRQAAHEDVHRVVSVAVGRQRGHVLLSGLLSALLCVRGSTERDIFLIDEEPVKAGDVASSEPHDVQMPGMGRPLGRVQVRREFVVKLLDQLTILFGQFFGLSDALAFVFDSQCHSLEGLCLVGESVFKGWSVTRRYVLDDRTAGRGALRPVKTPGSKRAIQFVWSGSYHSASLEGASRHIELTNKYLSKVKYVDISGSGCPRGELGGAAA